MTVFKLARMRRIALVALYLQTRAGRQGAPSGADSAGLFAQVMSREQLVAAILAARESRQLPGEARLWAA